MTVGASTESDTRASFSNYGVCVDMFAPGTNIISDWFSSSTATSVSSGTSESAPFVAGAAALCLEKYPSATPDNVKQTLLSTSTLDALTAVSGSPNRLLYSTIDALDTTPSDAQLLGDPSFEYGTLFWTSDICTVVNPTGCPPDEYTMMSLPSHTGNNHATIGGKPETFHLTSESVTIPPTVSKAELNFYLWVITKGKSPKISDTLTVELRDAAGNVVATLGTFSNVDANEAYTRRTFDVSRYRGKMVRISFTGLQSQGPPTWFLLDDVTLNIWK